MGLMLSGFQRAIPPRRALLRRYAWVTAVATFVLVIAGGLVTSTDSGLAVPDWPLSYGMWFPPMVGGIAYEHGHRMIAGVVGLMILGLAVWLWRAEPRAWLRRLGAAASAAVLAQALLGGLTVLWLLPPAVSIAHACLGPVVFCLVLCVAYGTRDGGAESAVRFDGMTAPTLRTLGLAIPPVVAGQLLLGAMIRHAGDSVTWHLAGAVSLVVMAGWVLVRMAAQRRRAPVAWGHAVRLLVLLGCQAALGTVMLGARWSVVMRTSHVGIGALVLGQAVLLAWEIVRCSALPLAGGRLAARPRPSRWSDYLELTKPRLSALVLVTTASGFWLGMGAGEAIGRLFPLLLGTALVAGGANALNQWSERDRDALMERTRHRPLPAGRLVPEAAFRFGLGLSVAGLVIMGIAADPLSSVLAGLGWALYVLVYTPMKRRTPLCTLVGAIPGALPPVIGWAGARHALGLEAWALFAILFVWQLPHFLALAVLYRDDYARAGFPMLPLVEADGFVTARQTVLYGMALLPVSLFPATIGVANAIYFYGAIVLSLVFFALAARTAWARSAQSARQLFRASVFYLPSLLGLLALNRG
jgi:protoheme IX farnesyltransferase